MFERTYLYIGLDIKAADALEQELVGESKSRGFNSTYFSRS